MIEGAAPNKAAAAFSPQTSGMRSQPHIISLNESPLDDAIAN